MFPNRGTLLEVGNRLGYLLNFFREEGWEEAQLASSSADMMTMIHVIEHVPDPPDPMAALKEVHRVLKPGGSFVMETPRYDTLMFRLLG